jgi:hypothetical protein
LFSFSANAQVILTKNSWPSVGTIQTTVLYDGTKEGPSGNNITWDFSKISAVSGIPPRQTNFVDPSATPFASEYTKSNLVSYLDNTYQYYLVDDNGVSNMGQVDVEKNSTSISKYADYQKVITFPFSYQSSLTDHFSGTYSSFSGTDSIPYIRTGNSRTVADGQGTIIQYMGFTWRNENDVKYYEKFFLMKRKYSMPSRRSTAMTKRRMQTWYLSRTSRRKVSPSSCAARPKRSGCKK